MSQESYNYRVESLMKTLLLFFMLSTSFLHAQYEDCGRGMTESGDTFPCPGPQWKRFLGRFAGAGSRDASRHGSPERVWRGISQK